jgi:hypothetical protein
MNWIECLDLKMQRDEPMPWFREGSLGDVDEVGEELWGIVRLTGDIITMVLEGEGEEEEEILERYIPILTHFLFVSWV